MPTSSKGGLRADAVLFGLTAFWGVTFVVVKDALVDADALTFLSLRFLIGAVVASALAGRKLLDPGIWKAGLLLAGPLFFGYLGQTLGLDATTPSRSAFITGLCVLLVPFASYALFRRIPRGPSVLGIALAVWGLYVLTGGASGIRSEGNTLAGDLLTLGGAAAFALHIALIEKLAPGKSPFALTSVQLWVVAALSGLGVIFAPTHLSLTPGLIAAVAVCGVFASALAISIQTWAQKQTTAIRAALIFSVEPVFAALVSTWMGRERLGRPELLGGGLILLGVLVSEVGTFAWDRFRMAR